MKIHIMGASCAGSTTLGTALGKRLSYPYFDSDQYFWEPSEVPFTVRRDPEIRNKMALEDLARQESSILGGSVINWGEEWLRKFDLVVFLYIPQTIRLQRLKNRELERYGDIIYTDPIRILQHQKFVTWAAGYDDNTTSGRNLEAHETWLTKLTCPLLEIRGNTSVQERVDLVLKELSRINS